MTEGHNEIRDPVVHDRDKSAGVVSRGIGAVVDLVVVVMSLSGIYLGALMIRLLFSVRDFTPPAPDIIFTATGFIVISILYLAACWAISGRTAGSVVMGLRVVNRHGNRIRPSIALLRAVLCTVFAIGLAWVAVDGRRRSVADVVLRTRVVYSR